MSPSGLGGLLSALGTGFQQLGRVGPWRPTSGECNSTNSPDVRDFKLAYGKLLHQQGYEEGSGEARVWLQELSGLRGRR
jgi:hypothetical protein